MASKVNGTMMKVIETLEGNRWTKNGMDRYYVDIEALDRQYEDYKDATDDDVRHICGSSKSRRNAKIYVDCANNELVVTGTYNDEKCRDAIIRMVEYVSSENEKVEEEAKAEEIVETEEYDVMYNDVYSGTASAERYREIERKSRELYNDYMCRYNCWRNRKNDEIDIEKVIIGINRYGRINEMAKSVLSIDGEAIRESLIKYNDTHTTEQKMANRRRIESNDNILY